MTRRPNPFNQPALEDALRDLGCPESFISTTVSNYRLFVPLVLAQLGEEGVFNLVIQCRSELGLREQNAAWHSAVKYIVAWAEQCVEEYKTRREHVSVPVDDASRQPRLL